FVPRIGQRNVLCCDPETTLRRHAYEHLQFHMEKGVHEQFCDGALFALIEGMSLVFQRKDMRMKTHGMSRTQKMSAAVGALMLTVVGCSQPLSTREKGTLAGGGLGAATGAIIGATVGAPGAGAAIGGALGAGAGALTGDQLQSRDEDLARQEAQLEAQRREIQQQRREIERERQRRQE